MFIEWCIDHEEIDEITLYALSEENFRRPLIELEKLYEIYQEELTKLITNEKIHKGRVRIKVWSTDARPLPRELLRIFDRLKRETREYGDKTLNMLIGYTGQSELLRAISYPVNRIKNLLFGLREADLERNLMVRRQCDLIMRTGTEEGKREAKSGFLLWQSAYSEYYHIDKFFPEATEEDFNQAWSYFKNAKKLKGL